MAQSDERLHKSTFSFQPKRKADRDTRTLQLKVIQEADAWLWSGLCHFISTAVLITPPGCFCSQCHGSYSSIPHTNHNFHLRTACYVPGEVLVKHFSSSSIFHGPVPRVLHSPMGQSVISISQRTKAQGQRQLVPNAWLARGRARWRTTRTCTVSAPPLPAGSPVG